MKKLVLIITFGAASFLLQAQNIEADTLVWESPTVFNLTNSDSFTHHTIFKSYGNHEVTWLQKNGSVAYSFTIVSSVGSWSDVSQAGQITFQISYEGKSGTLSFQRNSSGERTIVCDLRPSDPNGMAFRFDISNVTLLNP